ncbi:MAG: hypothetical protein ABR540_00390 [Acidimicrobiales bacterium]
MVGIAGLVALGACSGGTGVTSSTLDRPRTTSTTVSSSSSTSVADSGRARSASVTTVAEAATPARRTAGDATAIASPPGAGPEERISITGDGFTAEHWKTPNVPLWLAGGPSGCDFFAEADHQVTVTADGHLSGYFVVPSHGDCRQSSVGELPVAAGHYRIVYQCTACTIGEFDVTSSAPPAVGECQDVGFAANSDNVAGDIVAYGLSCEEAESVVRSVGGPLGPVNGAPRGEAEGFTCVRTGQEEGRGLPSASYECTRGSQRITFTRT